MRLMKVDEDSVKVKQSPTFRNTSYKRICPQNTIKSIAKSTKIELTYMITQSTKILIYH